MDPMIVVLFAMEFVSLMLAVILATAWNSFGRPRHALTWCGAFVVAAVGWAGNILLLQSYPDERWLAFLVGMLSMATWALMLLGFRQRVAERTAWRPLILASAASLALLALGTFGGFAGLRDGIPLLFSAAMLALSAATMIVRGGRGPAERAVITMLLAFAMLDLVACGIAVADGVNQETLFWTLMMLTAPSVFTGTGLFAVFLLAADLAERMGKLAARDPLTQVFNRRGFEDAAHRAVANARRQGQPLTIAVADLDRFKSINDRFGHAVGDQVLCRFVDHVRGSIRSGDLLGRIGGEEFALVLVDAAPDAAAEAVDRIRSALGELEIATPQGMVHVTASFGLTGPTGRDDTLEAMLIRADEALYQSKLAGRDCVTLAPSARPAGHLSDRAAPVRAAAFSGTAAR